MDRETDTRLAELSDKVYALTLQIEKYENRISLLEDDTRRLQTDLNYVETSSGMVTRI